MSRDSSVGIVTGYGLDGWGSIPGRTRFIFLFSTPSRPALRPTQPSIQWVLQALSLGVKRKGREANHSPPSSVKVKNGRVIPPFPIRLHTETTLTLPLYINMLKVSDRTTLKFNIIKNPQSLLRRHQSVTKLIYVYSWYNSNNVK
jgi:hypothetical protein